MSPIGRRDLLKGTAVLLAASTTSKAAVITGELPWKPDAADPPSRVVPGTWHFFTPTEALAVEALADRIIPPDPITPGGKDAGSAVFIDRQLAGPYGSSEGLYTAPPFQNGSQQQGPQSPQIPRAVYRSGLAALDRYCKSAPGGGPFEQLGSSRQDEILLGLESGKLQLEGVDGKSFFQTVLKDVQQGFFADPIYGSNRDMCAWKMIGFPGARYDYRDWVGRHNERYPHPPVSIGGRAEWSIRRT